MKHFTVPFNFVVTAEGVRSHKSGTKRFEEARKTIAADTGWLHVAASPCHDIEPTSRLAVNSVWANRQNARGKTVRWEMVKEIQNLTGLTD